MVLWSSPHGNIQSPRTGIVEGNISFGKHNLETGAYFLHKKKERKKNFNIQPFFFFSFSYFWVLVYCSLSSVCVSLLWSWSHMQFRLSHGPRHLLWSSQRGFSHRLISVFVQDPEKNHSKYNPWSCSCPPGLLSCPVTGVGLVGIHLRGGPAWGHLCQWLPVSSAQERFMLAASVDRLPNSHREAPSALTQKSRARLVLQDVLYFPCTRNTWIVDKKEA